MLTGPLDRRVTLERFTSTTAIGSGEKTKTWATLATIFASRRRASSRETLAAAEVSAAITDVFEIRWASTWSDLNPKDRLVFEGRTYDIVSVEEIGRRVGLRINAVARAD